MKIKNENILLLQDINKLVYQIFQDEGLSYVEKLEKADIELAADRDKLREEREFGKEEYLVPKMKSPLFTQEKITVIRDRK